MVRMTLVQRIGAVMGILGAIAVFVVVQCDMQVKAERQEGHRWSFEAKASASLEWRKQ